MSTGPHNLKENTASAADAVGIILFFGVGSTIAWFVAFAFLSDGHSIFPSILFGASAGGFGAWIIFAVAIHTIRGIVRLIAAKNHKTPPSSPPIS